MKNKYYYLILIVGLVACSKEDIVKEDNTPTTNTIPSIALSKPIDNHIVSIGHAISLEGLITDTEGLASMHYSIESINASYNYTLSNSIIATGKNKDFNEYILIPNNASIGNAVLKVYCTDTDNNQSSVISRNITIADNTEPNITYLNDTINLNSTIEVQAYKNENNVVDSVVIFNQTSSETVATITDIGGFRSIQRGTNGTVFHLLNNFQSTYTYQASGAAWLYFFEYDDSPSTSTTLKLYYN